MRINKYVAQATGLSRRKADELIIAGKVLINTEVATTGSKVNSTDTITLEGKTLKLETNQTIMLNKPVDYVCSRDGQGSKTVYELLPAELHHLKPVGRLDKDSSGLLLLTNDGELAQQLTHPSFVKQKVYQIELHKPLAASDRAAIERGIKLEDGVSKLALTGHTKRWTVTMHEGRNRQIRRTFEALGYRVTKLHRTTFGDFTLQSLASGRFAQV